MKKVADSKFRIVRKGYEQKDVDAYIAKTEADAAAVVAQQKKVIDDLEKTIAEQKDKLAEYEKKSRRISEAIMSALQKADEIEKLSAYKYVQEMEQLKTFHARWLTYYAKLIKKYPEFPTAMQAIGYKEIVEYLKKELTKKEAIEKLNLIRSFLKDKLCLELNRKTQIFKSTQGVNFCGYKINEHRLKIRDKGKRKLKKKVKFLEKQVKQGKMTCIEAHKYLSGHLGYINVANTKNLENKLFATDA